MDATANPACAAIAATPGYGVGPLRGRSIRCRREERRHQTASAEAGFPHAADIELTVFRKVYRRPLLSEGTPRRRGRPCLPYTANTSNPMIAPHPATHAAKPAHS